MAKKLYVYKSVDVCDPKNDETYHKQGGLLVITGGYPNDAVPRGTGNEFGRIEGEPQFGLPQPDLVVEVSEYLDDLVIAFPDSGCC